MNFESILFLIQSNILAAVKARAKTQKLISDETLDLEVVFDKEKMENISLSGVSHQSSVGVGSSKKRNVVEIVGTGFSNDDAIQIMDGK